MIMNIRDLEYIVETANHKSFSKAASYLYVSQPALSMQIKKFEDYHNIIIFERSPHNFIITETGKKIIEIARNLILESRKIKEISKLSQDKYGGDLKIAAFPTLAPYFFLKSIPLITKNFNKLKLFLIEEKTHNIIEELKSGNIDIAFLAEHSYGKEFKSKKVFTEEFLLAVNINHPLAKKKIIKRNDIEGSSLMLLEEGHCLRNQALEVCDIIGAHENSDFRASSLETLRQMVAIDAGITLIPEIAAISNKNIRYLKIKDGATRTISLVYRKDYYREELVRNIHILIANQLK